MGLSLDNRAQWRVAGIEWLPVVLGLLLLYVPTFYGLATTLWQQDDYAHGPLILAVLVWLIWDKRQVLLMTPTRDRTGQAHAALLPGISILVFGLLLYVIGRSLGIKVFETGSLIPVLVGVLLALRGRSGLRSLWFMLLFTIYLVPLPASLIDGITGPLKQHVSSIAEQILYSAGYPIARNGVTLTIGQYQLLVADACSGINSMFSLSAIGLLYLYMMKRVNKLHIALVVASLLPIAFCANIVRVLFLVLLTYYFGDGAGQGFLHGFSGMVLFVVALLLILGFDSVLAKLIKPPKPAS